MSGIAIDLGLPPKPSGRTGGFKREFKPLTSKALRAQGGLDFLGTRIGTYGRNSTADENRNSQTKAEILNLVPAQTRATTGDSNGDTDPLNLQTMFRRGLEKTNQRLLAAEYKNQALEKILNAEYRSWHPKASGWAYNEQTLNVFPKTITI